MLITETIIVEYCIFSVEKDVEKIVFLLLFIHIGC